LSDVKKQNQSRPSAGIPKSEYLNPKRVKKDAILKKQSQFVPGTGNVKPFMETDYNNSPACGAEENKANSSGQSMPERNCRTDQSQYCAPGQAEGAGKSEKSVPAANSLTG